MRSHPMTSYIEDLWPVTPVKAPFDLMDFNANSDIKSTYQDLTPPAVTCKSEEKKCFDFAKCGGCSRPIHERYLMKVADNSWHESCVKCAVCQALLSHSCFVKNGLLLCKADYTRYYRPKQECFSCRQMISKSEMVMRVHNYVYHLNCFVCIRCGYNLRTGDEFVERDGSIFCRMDYEKDCALYNDWFPPYANSDCESIFDESDLDGKNGPKRPRTILTTTQRRKFKQSFEVNPKPCRKVRESLANETGLSVRVVQVWFQNQRAKMKKIARKQQQQQQKDSTSDKKDGKEDISNDSGSESDSASKTSGRKCHSDCADGSAGECSSVPLDDMYSSSIMTTGQANPIDQLYSMQNSYFNSVSEKL